jgi:shikimate kinase
MKWVVLIGFMGAGKSTIGKELAGRLKLPFVDTDELIEEQEGKSIRELFDSIGEAAFRGLEAQVIRSLNSHDSMVIAVGGGLPVYHNNMEYLNGNGLTIYLNHEPEVLVERLVADRFHRPLVSNLLKDDLLKFVQQSIQERDTFYKKAKIILSTDQQHIPFILQSIRNLIG